MRRRKIKVRLTQERDLPLLRFLWRWKVSTTMALCKKFYPKAQVETGYRRLIKLESAGFIRCPVDVTGKVYLWTLDKKGFEAIKNDLPTLKEEGFRSENLMHDYWVMAVHLGDFLLTKPSHIVPLTEQILRRTHNDFLPDWIPEGHRPDGYWCRQIEDKVHQVALEVELNAKKNASYELIDGFYRSEKVDDVLWVVPQESLGQRIYRQFLNYGNGEIGPHSLVTLEEFKKKGWTARVSLGKGKGKSISQLVHNEVTRSPQPVVIELLMNTQKSPHRSKAYKDSLKF